MRDRYATRTDPANSLAGRGCALIPGWGKDQDYTHTGYRLVLCLVRARRQAGTSRSPGVTHDDHHVTVPVRAASGGCGVEKRLRRREPEQEQVIEMTATDLHPAGTAQTSARPGRLYWWGLLMTRRRRLVFVAWAVLIAAGFALVPRFTSSLS